MFVAEDRLTEAWALVDAGVEKAEVERRCDGEPLKAQKWAMAHKDCTRCARGEVHRTGVSGAALVVTVGLAGELPTTSEVPVRGIARAQKRPAREAIPAGQARE